MAIDHVLNHRQMAAMGKYHRLYSHLRSLPEREWKATFSDVEALLGFDLPESARLHRPWWSNQINGHSRLSHGWLRVGKRQRLI